EPLRSFLRQIYGDLTVDRADPAQGRLCEALDQIVVAWGHLEQSPAEGPIVDLSEAIGWWAQTLADEPLREQPAGDQVELLSWLDLFADGAERPILIGCNEDVFPARLPSDGFLPESLRGALGLIDRHRRGAQDTYALQAVIASRPRALLIAGRQTDAGDPLMLSRLLLRDTPKAVARRVGRFVQPAEPLDTGLTLGPVEDDILGDPNRWPPPPSPVRMDRLSVTAFADYLRCPYRFYLRHVLGLGSLDDEAQELTPAAFGSIVHGVLSDWAGSKLSDSTDEQKIFAELKAALLLRFDRTFGAEGMPAIEIQKRQLLERLSAFARWQARRSADGWQIMAHERLLEAPLPIDGPRFTVYGKIDRIDRHRDDGRLVLFDYKTGEAAARPESRHRRSGRWVDLQLPLYHHLALSNGYEPLDGLGYIALPSDPDGVDAVLAEWTPGQLDEAVETAAGIVADIRAGRFEINPAFHSPFDPFDALCGVSQLSHLLGDGEAGS
ncbi:MAG: PD-(D/E)XK nuclease family protein, partial [Phycisphaeraceae bacterium]|nr:PD-(D/E)XK nuclease family protein [Phycisphaeraceae bacterium]